MSLANDPDRGGLPTSIEESEEIAAAEEARGQLLIDGPAPSTEAIVETMRDHDVTAGRAARALLGYVDLEEGSR